MKVLNLPQNLVHPSEMKDGQIGIIRRWNSDSYVERIVQKYGSNGLIVLGEQYDKSFTRTDKWFSEEDSLIEILPPGTTLII